MIREFKLKESELKEMKQIVFQPIIMVGNYIPNPQEDANAFWKRLGDNYGFIWDTVFSVNGKSHKYFEAEIK